MSSRGRRRASAIATHAFQPDESLRFARCSSTLRVPACRSVSSRCSAAIATHAFQPRDSLRCIRCRSPRLALDRLRTTSCHCTCQLTHPRDIPRCIRCRTALDMRARSFDSSAASQLTNAGASLRLTMNVTQRRASPSSFRRLATIAAHEFQPADCLRCSRCSSARRAVARAAAAFRRSAADARHEFQPADSLRFLRKLTHRRISSIASSRSDAIAAHEFQPMESLRFARRRIPLCALSRSSSAFCCSAAIAAHEFQPAVSLRFTKWSKQR